MITAAHVEIYARFKGDVDMYQRAGSPGAIGDAWSTIEHLRQRLFLVEMKLASVELAQQTESDLLSSTTDEDARCRIRELVDEDVKAQSQR